MLCCPVGAKTRLIFTCLVIGSFYHAIMSEAIHYRPRAFCVNLLMPGGDPDGVKIIEKSNWNGAGLVIPRALFNETRGRAEFQRAGVYLLVGPVDDSQLPRMYIGEGDPIGPRLDAHAKNKDFWTHVVAFTSSDQKLNKADVQFLESKLIELASAAKRCTLDNGNVPQAPSLSESAAASAEGFLADILLCLPVLGYHFFERVPSRAPAALEFLVSAKGLVARGYEAANGFIVRAGSQASKTEVNSIHNYMTTLRRSLIDHGVFVDKNTCYEVTQDYAFDSPSTAAGVVLGRTANGRIEWKTIDGRTLKEIQESEIEPIEPRQGK
jgi:Domain of unknown function (DUF4357)